MRLNEALSDLQRTLLVVAKFVVLSRGEPLDQNTFNLVVAIAAIIVALSFIVQAFMFAFTYRALQKLSSTAAAVQAKAEPVIEKMGDRKSTRLNSSHSDRSRMPSSA